MKVYKSSGTIQILIHVMLAILVFGFLFRALDDLSVFLFSCFFFLIIIILMLFNSMYYFIVENKKLIVKNSMMSWFEEEYDIKDIEKLKIDTRTKHGLGLMVETKIGKKIWRCIVSRRRLNDLINDFESFKAPPARSDMR